MNTAELIQNMIPYDVIDKSAQEAVIDFYAVFNSIREKNGGHVQYIICGEMIADIIINGSTTIVIDNEVFYEVEGMVLVGSEAETLIYYHSDINPFDAFVVCDTGTEMMRVAIKEAEKKNKAKTTPIYLNNPYPTYTSTGYTTTSIADMYAQLVSKNSAISTTGGTNPNWYVSTSSSTTNK